ncbi:IclR family transcriptional regulator [Ruegeria sp.]|uniref:IclR family transcriptional regulator n=1 Tax=Ruegeria sp. TaxID=1879320 RepID=UPI003B5BDB97
MDFIDDTGDEKDRNFVTALARGLDLLRAFDPGDPELSNTDFAERTGLPKPTVSRMTHTLVKLDYLNLDERTGLYRLGPGVLKLGLNVLASSEMADRARAPMKTVLEGPNPFVSVSLGHRHRDEAIYIAVERSREVAALSLGVGASVPLFLSATGRVILIGLPEDVREATFEQADRKDPSRAQERRKAYLDAQSEYEHQGYVTGFGSWRKDVMGIAVPVFSLDPARAYGLNVGGHAFHVSADELKHHYAENLIAAGEKLSIKI